ncbi:hypothetical protein BGZ61DRAFT_498997 [Ilyonectria robusta]|uniref:uncharacterized protein n=1 Tax=Ilyonectria robusta TaxID=1079257 RepID=UPI001E8ECA25|nr:uncharacterized protein BGZ61DRAFT_498997 [Ilyonectria robusta]KAH8664845.1 hypothetical protein BGZ61DRAFT_498997 [Ilyonectria robusta]
MDYVVQPETDVQCLFAHAITLPLTLLLRTNCTHIAAKMIFDPNSNSLPKRSELPDVPGTPKGSAWFWGKNDELGRLNLLTPQRRAAASKLIRTGEVVSLNWSAELPDPPMFGREPFKHSIKSLGPAGNDEVLSMNSQSGSQAWSTEGVVGRGVLLDYWSYCGKSYDVNTRHPISAKDLMACAKAQGVEFQYGDILLIRTGWIETYEGLSKEDRIKLTEVPAYQHDFVGVDQTHDMADFLHDNYFSVVASDSPAFEVWPQIKEWNHHINLLPLWGVPIGELWDMEKLAEVCKDRQQYAFFFVSIPMNVQGAVGSYSNAIAMF